MVSGSMAFVGSILFRSTLFGVLLVVVEGYLEDLVATTLGTYSYFLLPTTNQVSMTQVFTYIQGIGLISPPTLSAVAPLLQAIIVSVIYAVLFAGSSLFLFNRQELQ